MKIIFKKLFIGIAVIGITVFTSCKDDEKTPENQTNPTTQMNNTSANAEETPDVNPPHGQPGHRCDMPVGASLTEANNTQPEMTTSPIRVRQDKPAKNPPHGEPFHDCSIPVGGDLKS
ncbi:hypothetical protein DET49_10929 [Salegentibacter sp. 24]|jgi:hypothetical protein|uniref:hypothetical protein n=1 Tax=Salegentibacter sp. 24 TaxID=2183986 RepID=UPI00105ED4EC|nr:hypothetical protein [Salegentibacter sp. 24]TDN88079.1 hypothetical protein DET49_10929 [Salegentibacter sp. 24]